MFSEQREFTLFYVGTSEGQVYKISQWSQRGQLKSQLLDIFQVWMCLSVCVCVCALYVCEELVILCYIYILSYYSGNEFFIYFDVYLMLSLLCRFYCACVFLYRVFIKYCVFSEDFKIFRTLFSLGVGVCTPTRQVEHQRCSRTGRFQKNHKT